MSELWAQRTRYLLLILLFAFLYLVSGRLGLLLQAYKGVTPIWPPAGLAVMWLWWFGLRSWPGIVIGVAVLAYTVGIPPAAAIPSLIGNTIEPVLSVFLLLHFKFDDSFTRLRNVLLFVAIAALLSPIVSATIGAISFCSVGITTWNQCHILWLTWWLGNAIGVIVIAPLVLMWRKRPHNTSSFRTAELLLLATFLVATSWLVFGGGTMLWTVPLPLAYLLFPFVIWGSVRFSQHGATLCTVIISILAVGGGLEGYGPFVLNEGLIAFILEVSFIGVVSLIGLVLAAVFTERQLAEEQSQAYLIELEQSNRELRDLAFISSHQLQEPLRKIEIFSERLYRRYTDAMGSDGKKDIDRLQRSVNQMQALVHDLLTYSRITTTPLQFTSINMRVLVEDVVAELNDYVQRVNGQVQIGELPTIEADRSQMKQLIHHLLVNGLKFHREGQRPLVKIEGQYVANQEICEITVADNGIGFDEKYLNKIFTIFQRLHQQDDYEGNGTGLTICRKITERHNGHIQARSTPGQGTKFIVTLSVEKGEPVLSTPT